jgi:hypothetical protein
MVMMPPPVLAQANMACAQSSIVSNTAQPYVVDCISVTTPCLLLYSIDRAGKIPPLYACVQVQQLLKSSYEDNDIDIPTADVKTCIGECISSTILWHK